jgi:hypothetical protein
MPSTPGAALPAHQVLRDGHALDMEASAFFAACDFYGVKALPVVKAVSDFGDAHKSDAHHSACLRAATDAVVAFVQLYLGNRRAGVPGTVAEPPAAVDPEAERFVTLTNQIAELRRAQEALRAQLLERLADDGAPSYLPASATQCVRAVSVKSTRLTLALLTKHRVPVDTIAAIQDEAAKVAPALDVTTIAAARKRKAEQPDVIDGDTAE